MGRYTFRLPDIGEGIAEAEIVAWHVAVGDRIEEDGPLADMMTDKATVEMESPISGVVRELAGDVGQRIAIGAMLAVIETEGGEETEAPAPKAELVRERIDAETPDAEDTGKGAARRSAFTRPAPVEATSSPSVTATRKGTASRGAERPAGGGKALASPAVRARAKRLGIDLGTVPASDGRVVRHGDLDDFLVSCAKSGNARPSTRETGDPAPAVEQLPGAGEQIKVIGLRRRIAENMAASKRHIPHFSYIEECDVTALEDVRAQLNGIRGGRPKLTPLPLIVCAICRALPEFPMINARYDDEASVVTRYASVHLGVATQTPGGLMVPVIRDAQALSVWQIAAEIARLADAARTGAATAEDLTGSTLTVTSLGPLGGIAATPVINRPEVAIIGPNRIIERPVFADGDRIERRKLMNISISCDHRVVDGWDAARFVQALKRQLEAPLVLLAG